MAQLRGILLRLEVRPAGRRCGCKHNGRHSIVKGQARMIVKEPGIATGEDGYCADCSLAMIEQARAVLDELEGQLRASLGDL
jgi:hypothetical protein